MNKKRQDILMLAIAAAFIVTISGCFGLAPEEMVPKTITPPVNDRRIDGSINIQAFVPYSTKGKVAMFESYKLKAALETAIGQYGLFRRIEQGDADYVLDVWIEDAKREMKPLGEGYIIDVSANWRLARASDGKVIACGTTSGHGASHALGTSAYLVAMRLAMQENIQKGLYLLAGHSTSLPALCATDALPSMGPVDTEGFRHVLQEGEKERESWPQVHTGMTEAEAWKILPSMAKANRKHEFYVDIDSATGKNLSLLRVFFSYTYPMSYKHKGPSPFYKLKFINDKLVEWKAQK